MSYGFSYVEIETEECGRVMEKVLSLHPLVQQQFSCGNTRLAV